MEFLSTILYAVVGIVVVGYVYLYITTRQYLKETYTTAAEKPKVEEKVVVNQVVSPYTTQQILGVDDYEYNMVFQNENDREVSTRLLNKLASAYPMDWAAQPPSSAAFQQGMKEYFQNKAAEKPLDVEGKESPYTALSDKSLQPPDTLGVEQEERKLLQTYNPKLAGDLTTYDVEDAITLIKKIYDARGEIPEIVKNKDNVYEVVGVRKKDEKIVYEETDDSGVAAGTPVASQGENVTDVPQAATDMNTALDPFYEPGPGGRQGRWNYRQWTPGLERMFAPTEPRTNWY